MRLFLHAIKSHGFSFLSMPGIVCMGFGIKTTRNCYTGTPSIVIGVKRKIPPHALPPDRLIPRHIDYLPTDVIEVGSIKFLGYALPEPGYPPADQADFRKKRVRPAQPGVSIGHFRTTAGTFGAVVKGNIGNGIAILSNNHILANGTDGYDGLSRPGDPVLQPGPSDRGGPKDIIARLHSFTPLIPENNGKGINTIDAAIAVPYRPDLVKSSILGLGGVSKTSPASPGMPVFKSGRSSAVTRGLIQTTGTTIRVENEDKLYVFEDQIGTTAKSDPGDSGSLMVNQFGRAVGLLFAGSEKYSFANPIDKVLNHFRVSLYV